MNDLISRKRVLKAIEKLHVYGFATLDEDKLIETINKLPSVTPKEKTEWIPVSERVPKECVHTYDNNFHDYIRSESVLVTVRNKVTNLEYVFHNLAYISNGEWYIDDGYEHNQFKNCLVLAWTPLPQPYKAESEETDADSN